MELRALFPEEWEAAGFGRLADDDTAEIPVAFVSQRDVPVDRSPYLRQRIRVWKRAASLQALSAWLLEQNADFDGFKFVYLKHPGTDLQYPEWISIARHLGEAIQGTPDMKNPRCELAFLPYRGDWFLGQYQRSRIEWRTHSLKPMNNSHSLKTAIARSMVNLAVGPELTRSFVDPCCGVGTVVIAALSLGLDVRGFDINPQVACQAVDNLKAMGWPPVVSVGDIHHLEGQWDAAVLDLPYGLFTPVKPGQVAALIRRARRIARRVVFLAFEDLRAVIKEADFRIIDQCLVTRGRLVRHVYLCV
jgi:predicted RNA methylase